MANYVTWSDEMTIEAMRLRLSGKSNREVAKIMGLNFNSVKARFNRLSHAKAGLDGATVWDQTPESLERYRKWEETCKSNGWRNSAWTAAECGQLRKLLRDGLKAGAIADRIKGRSESAVRAQIERLGLTSWMPRDEEMPWYVPDRPTHSGTWAGCSISVTGDDDEAASALLARVVASANHFGKLRRARAAAKRARAA